MLGVHNVAQGLPGPGKRSRSAGSCSSYSMLAVTKKVCTQMLGLLGLPEVGRLVISKEETVCLLNSLMSQTTTQVSKVLMVPTVNLPTKKRTDRQESLQVI